MEENINVKIENILNSLSKSQFRSSFHLNKEDFNYINKVGLDKIKEHCYFFITTRLAPSMPKNDGKQTPYRGHPVFKGQHATATCCRKCLFKWHHFRPGVELTKNEIDYIVLLIMTWIQKEIERNKND